MEFSCYMRIKSNFAYVKISSKFGWKVQKVDMQSIESSLEIHIISLVVFKGNIAITMHSFSNAKFPIHHQAKTFILY